MKFYRIFKHKEVYTEFNMSHFAKVENSIVTQVLVVEQEFIDTGELGNPATWIQTSYNTKGGIHYDPLTGEPSTDQSKALRKNFAGIGYTYDKERDAFIPPKSFESWKLNEISCLWEAPILMPSDGKLYFWDEPLQDWISYQDLEDHINQTPETNPE